jgi:hypothetical protein
MAMVSDGPGQARINPAKFGRHTGDSGLYGDGMTPSENADARAALVAELGKLHRLAASPSYERLAKIEIDGDRYPKSTINDKVNGRSAVDARFIRFFVRACALQSGGLVKPASVEEWIKRLEKLMHVCAVGGGLPDAPQGPPHPNKTVQIFVSDCTGVPICKNSNVTMTFGAP